MERFKLVLKSEFRLKQLRFSTIIYDRVFFSMWRIPPIAVIFYKLVLMIYVDFWLIQTAVGYHGGPVPGTSMGWGAWLTNWTYTLLAIHLTLSTLAVIVYHVIRFHKSRAWLFSRSPAEHWRLMQDDVTGREITTESNDKDTDDSGLPTDTEQSSSIKWYVVAPLWVFFDMSAAFVPLVTLMFFAFLWPGMSGPISMDNLQLHGINTVCMFIDLLLSAIPVRILHVIYPLTYGIIYIVFSAIYWAADHKRVMYPGVLDWNEAGKTIGIIFGIILLLVVLQLLLFALHKLKVCIYFTLHTSDHTSSQERKSYQRSGACLELE